jgi:hypothetical protein
MRRFQISLRSVFVAMLAACIALTIAQWWFQPYVLTGSYSNGVRAWEQWNRRTISGRLTRLAMIRYYASGQKAYEYRDGKERYWSHAGEPIDRDTFWKHHAEDSLIQPQDKDSRHPWPYHDAK